MAAFDNRHSRLVAWLKIILPLCALGLLSTLFLFSRPLDTTGGLPLASVDLERITRDQGIGSPFYSGVAADGTAVSLSADAATPLRGGRAGFAARNLRVALELPSGLAVEISAGNGAYDNERKLAELRGDVRLTTSDGYEVVAPSLFADLDARRIYTVAPVAASGPLGQLHAGEMVLRQQDAPDGASTHELIFQGGVDLVYLPAKRQDGGP